jgi:hypothetical protein
MHEEIPEDMQPDVHSVAMLLLEEVRAAGWHLSAIEWVRRDTEVVRTVKFSATRPTGKSVLVVCEEGMLPKRLQALLNEN